MNNERALGFRGVITGGAYKELVSSSYVFDELMSWFSRHPQKKLELGQKLRSGVVRIEWVTEKVEQSAWRLLTKHLHHPLSLTDCTSFVLMDTLRIRDVFTFDDDFTRLGKYRVLPR